VARTFMAVQGSTVARTFMAALPPAVARTSMAALAPTLARTFMGGPGAHGGAEFHGPEAPHLQPGTRSGAFSGFDHGGVASGFSAAGSRGSEVGSTAAGFMGAADFMAAEVTDDPSHGAFAAVVVVVAAYAPASRAQVDPQDGPVRGRSGGGAVQAVQVGTRQECRKSSEETGISSPSATRTRMSSIANGSSRIPRDAPPRSGTRRNRPLPRCGELAFSLSAHPRER